MKVKMVTSYTHLNTMYKVNYTFNLDDKLAKDFIDKKLAIEIKENESNIEAKKKTSDLFDRRNHT